MFAIRSLGNHTHNQQQTLRPETEISKDNKLDVELLEKQVF
jgi:hypothetical protein